MELVIYTLILFFINKAFCEDKYEFKIMGNSIKNDILELPNKSKFNIFEGKGAFTDNRGNIGDFSSRGVRQTDEDGISKRISNNVDACVINAGDGSHEHTYSSPFRCSYYKE